MIERLRSKKRQAEKVITVKKFDAIIRPYLTRVKKAFEIAVSLAAVKKMIFEKDLSISEFFRFCQNQQITNTITPGKTYFNTNSTSGQVFHTNSSTPFKFSIVTQ